LSQVIVTDDNLRDRREASRAQEHKIVRFTAPNSGWLRPMLKTDPVAMIIGVLAAPVAAFWGLLMAFLGISLAVILWIFRAFAAILGGSRSSNSKS
jgi:hypothetical protein